MARYAENTDVTAEKSRMEIEATLRRYKADAFAYGTEGNKAMVRFRMADRWVQFVLTLPDRASDEFNIYMRGSVRYQREDSAAEKMWEQACRQRWRALALVIKAKLEAVSAGITTVEDEFLAHTLLPNGQTFGAWAKPEIDRAYQVGQMPTSLLLVGPSNG